MKLSGVRPGMQVTPLSKKPTTRQLVMWAGASGDYNPIHYDKDYAIQRGLPGVIVHGQLVLAFIGQMLTDWLGRDGEINRLSVSYKGMNLPGDTINCRGIIKEINQTENRLHLDVWAENPGGEKTVTGTAVVSLYR